MPTSPAAASAPAHSRRARALVVLTVSLALASCWDNEPTGSARRLRPEAAALSATEAGTVVLVGAGSIARCDRPADAQTAALLDAIPGIVFTTGDNVYGGRLEDYEQCLGPTWGRHKARMRPAPGEIDQVDGDYSGYFGYFGAAAGAPERGYYSYDAGTNWHIVVLNSEIDMSVGSAQEQWLRADLAATAKPCVLAYWHFPRFSSYSTAVRSLVKPAWDALYEAQADVVVNGHYRLYERFALQTPDEQAAPDRGIRQFTIGTGGQGLDGTAGLTPRPNSERRIVNVNGVLKLTLHEYTYAWEFVPVEGQTARDSGEGACHGRPGFPPPNQAPRADAGGPYEAEHAVTFDATASSDVDRDTPLTYRWSFDDGSTALGPTPTKSYAADGAYTATLVVTDALGLAGAPVTTSIRIGNLPPRVDAGHDVTVQLGQTHVLRGSFDDLGGAGDGPWAWTIAWGDGEIESGTTATLGAPVAPAHAWGTAGDHVVRLTITDREGASATDEMRVTVRDPGAVAVLLAAGDIAECTAIEGAEQTAALLDAIPGIVAPLGDNAYLSGTSQEYAECYAPTWGRHKSRTRPAPGNHDYATPGAAGYFAYFGAAAGDPAKGYYSYTAGEWLVVVLNSASGSANRSATSPQVQWLRALLAATDRECVVAYMHHPHFTSASGRRSGEWNVIDLWNALYEGGVELVLAGHDHLYDRFAPMRPDGTVDAQHGIRQITVGNGGGEGLYLIGTVHPNSERRINSSFGVAKITLRSGGYDWEFVPVAGSAAGDTDSGSGGCHGRPGGAPPTNAAPVANAGGPYLSERVVRFDASLSRDPENFESLSYYWTFGDGTVGSGARPVKSYAANGTYTATVVVTDALGLSSAPASAEVTIRNLEPVVDAGDDATVIAGTEFVAGATFADAGGLDDGPWTWTIAWGDGTSSTGLTAALGGPIAASHAFATPGTWVVRVDVRDADGGAGHDERTVQVISRNERPVANAGGPYRTQEVASLDASASADPDGHLPLSYAWDFGDGTTGSGRNPVKAYAADGEYVVRLVVTDALGLASLPVTTTVTRGNLSPVVSAGPDAVVQTGDAFTLDASFTDAGGTADAPWSWTVEWGDGSSTTGEATELGARLIRSHAYAARGLYTVRLTVRDRFGGAGTDELSVRVSDVVLAGAANIARCDKQDDERTALLLDGHSGPIFTAGDNVNGATASDFANCYAASWGRHKSRTRPALGETDLAPAGAAGYFGYFGAAAGDPAKGWYSYDLGSWHIVVLNSSASMTATSAQVTWLKADLAATSKACILAYWHSPRFSSFSTGVRSEVKPLWDALHAAGADVVVNGHYRLYERFAPQSPTEQRDLARGIRQFTVGTGGHGLDAAGGLPTGRANSEVRITGILGVLKLALDADSYSWQFVPVAGQAAGDAGTTACH